MARAARNLPCAEQFHIESPAPARWSPSFLSLYRAEASEEHTLSNHEETNEIQYGKQSRYTILASLLSAHTDIRHGMLVHHYMVLKGLESSLFLGSHLLRMYFRCHSNENGFALSASMCDRNVYSWNHLMQACSEQGQIAKTLKFFHRMQEEAVLPNKITFLTTISVHAHQTVGVAFERIHACMQHSEFRQDVILATALLKVYGQCSRMKDVSCIFNTMISRDVVLWTTMMIIFAEQRQIREALYLFEQMQQEVVTPTLITFVALLGVCAKHAALEEGKLMHTQVLINGLESDIAVANALINMYGSCASLDDACTVFDKLHERNVVTWTSIITFYAQKGFWKVALFLFHQMQSEAILPNQFTFVSTIVACACRAVLDEGRRLHSCIEDNGIIDAVAGAALVNMYDKCGSLMEAEKVFDNVSKRDLVLWNAMIAAYAQNKKLKQAVKLFESMQVEGLRPDKTTLSNIFAVCANCDQQVEGERVHAYIMENGLEMELIVGNSLVHMYAHCGELDHAKHIFNNLMDKDTVSWTVMIAAHALYRQWEISFNLFDQMQQEGHLPDKVTYIRILDVCGSISSQSHYRCIHARLAKTGFDTDIVVQNALISLCGKWGNLQDAENIFSMMPVRDVVTWNSMIGVYSGYGNSTKVLEVAEQMCEQGVKPDRVTFVSVLSVCASQTLFAEGRHMHMWAVDVGCDVDNVLESAILTMYGKCGSIDDARRCFDSMQERNVLTWNAMMAVYSQHGLGKEALGLFSQMQGEKLVPDALSFLAVLVACSHAGLVDEGKEFFTSMVQEHGILPTSDHYGCLVDLFGRVGQLDEAKDLIYSLSSQYENASLEGVLGACRLEDNADSGEGAARHAFELQSDNPTDYVVLSNIYSALTKRNKAMAI